MASNFGFIVEIMKKFANVDFFPDKADWVGLNFQTIRGKNGLDLSQIPQNSTLRYMIFFCPFRRSKQIVMKNTFNNME